MILCMLYDIAEILQHNFRVVAGSYLGNDYNRVAPCLDGLLEEPSNTLEVFTWPGKRIVGTLEDYNKEGLWISNAKIFNAHQRRGKIVIGPNNDFKYEKKLFVKKEEVGPTYYLGV